jgi:dipicolinate synthase subunit A
MLKTIIENTPVSIYTLKALVIGYGRVGKAAVRILTDNRIYTAVTNRDEKTLASGGLVADITIPFRDFGNSVVGFDVIINTVPDLTLTKEILDNIAPDTLIIDLASLPGGVDFAYAKKRGITALHELGIPGKIAPKTASEYLFKIIKSNLY